MNGKNGRKWNNNRNNWFKVLYCDYIFIDAHLRSSVTDKDIISTCADDCIYFIESGDAYKKSLRKGMKVK